MSFPTDNKQIILLYGTFNRDVIFINNTEWIFTDETFTKINEQGKKNANKIKTNQ